jgi:phosphate/sulfate permease
MRTLLTPVPPCRSLKQAVLLAVIFEFTGALVLGRVSAETIAGNDITPPTCSLDTLMSLAKIAWLRKPFAASFAPQ